MEEYTSFWWWVTAIIVGIVGNFLTHWLKNSYQKRIEQRRKDNQKKQLERDKEITDLVPHPEILFFKLTRLILFIISYIFIALCMILLLDNVNLWYAKDDSQFIRLVKMFVLFGIFAIMFGLTLNFIIKVHEHFTITRHAIDGYIRKKITNKPLQ
jgi:hypothetical protein